MAFYLGSTAVGGLVSNMVEGKQWTYTSDGSSTSNIILVSDDNWIKTNWNKSNLVVLVRPKFVSAAGAGLRSINFVCGSNSPIFTDGTNTFYSIYNRFTNDTGSTNSYLRRFPLTNWNDVGDLRATSSGNIELLCWSPYQLQAGEWSVIAFLM